jgi:hypothetical protein
VPQRGFEPLTHALRIRRSPARLISINTLRTPYAVQVEKTPRKSVCVGTKVATVLSEPHLFMIAVLPDGWSCNRFVSMVRYTPW